MTNHKISTSVITTVLLAGLLGACGKTDDRPKADPAVVEAGKTLANDGRGEVLACASCHGANGEGNFAAGFPRLAGLHPDYIAKQLQDFQRDPLDMGVAIEPIARDYSKTPRVYNDLTIYTPGIRNDPIMNGLASAMSTEEIASVAAYYGSLPFTATPVPADFQSLERGMELAVRGKPEYMVPRCDACHGPRGEGFGPHFPPLAGQPQQYIINQINKWQSGMRDNDHLAMMKNTANQLTDGDKINVAKYYSNQSYSVNVK
jgi:cytochrome c553